VNGLGYLRAPKSCAFSPNGSCLRHNTQDDNLSAVVRAIEMQDRRDAVVRLRTTIDRFAHAFGLVTFIHIQHVLVCSDFQDYVDNIDPGVESFETSLDKQRRQQRLRLVVGSWKVKWVTCDHCCMYRAHWCAVPWT
jgi:hypothetical protein